MVSRGDGGVVVVVVMAQILNTENWGDYFTSYTHCGLTSWSLWIQSLDPSNRFNQKILDKAESKEVRKRLMYMTSKELEFAFIISLAKIKEMNLQVFMSFSSFKLE